jgi:hypothetical protein
MVSTPFNLLLVTWAAMCQQAPAPDYYAAATAGARNLSNQVQYLAQAIVTAPPAPIPPNGVGLFEQVQDVLGNLQLLQIQLNNKGDREQVVLNFLPIDGMLNGLAGELKGMERWNPALRMTVRRVRYAQQDLYFAILGTDGAPATQAQVALRQTLALQDRADDCLGHVRSFFLELPSLPAWNAEFADFRGGLNEMLKLENSKASRDDIKRQVLKTDQSWAKLVDRFNKLGTNSNLMLRSNFAQVDRLLDRLSTLYGVPDRRALLQDPFAQ